jgi:hypothetical protein
MANAVAVTVAAPTARFLTYVVSAFRRRVPIVPAYPYAGLAVPPSLAEIDQAIADPLQ